MKALCAVLTAAVCLFYPRPDCMGDTLTPFLNDNPSGTGIHGNDSNSGSFVMPVSSKNGRQGRNQTIIASISTGNNTTSPQVTVHSVPGVQVLTGEDYIVTAGVDDPNLQVNDPAKSAVQQSDTPVLGNTGAEQQTAALDTGKAQDNEIIAVRRSAGEKQLSEAMYPEPGSNYAPGVRISSTLTEGYLAGKTGIQFIPEQGSSLEDGGDDSWLNIPGDVSFQQDYLRVAYRDSGAEKVFAAAEAKKAAGEGMYEDPRDHFGEEDGGEGRTARPGEGKRRKKIIEPLKELFYKVSYLGKFPKGTPLENNSKR